MNPLSTTIEASTLTINNTSVVTNYQEGNAWCTLTGLIHYICCAHPKPGLGFPCDMSWASSMMWAKKVMDCWYWWNCWQPFHDPSDYHCTSCLSTLLSYNGSVSFVYCKHKIIKGHIKDISQLTVQQLLFEVIDAVFYIVLQK